MPNNLNTVKKAIDNKKFKDTVSVMAEKTRDKLKKMDENSKDPNINTITGKPNFKSNDFKVDKALGKLPSNSFAKMSTIVDKVSTKIK